MCQLIRISSPDPDPGMQKLSLKKEKLRNYIFLEFFTVLEAFPQAWMSFVEVQDVPVHILGVDKNLGPAPDPATA